MDIVIGAIRSCLTGLAANLRTDAIFTRREKRLQALLEREDTLQKALASTRLASHHEKHRSGVSCRRMANQFE